ncbi:MAG: ATP-dependent DNA helicase [Bdellovibrionales bacterium CG10_big_fil_rev_8_21_14_0_10_45_34]|nr:MAG: ATP-dependent DNA helicase [Bdellovibrionales bacterium CG10_big_fil_rev_8_21_14_0_10_45_34]
MRNWVSHLNENQKEATLHNQGPLLILAGAGSGKTTVLVARAGRLLDEKVCAAGELVVLTFTNKAARELKHRVTARFSAKSKLNFFTGTFHSFGLDFLRKHWRQAGLPERFGLIDSGDAKAIIKELLRDIRHDEKDRFDLERLGAEISAIREGHSRSVGEDPYLEVATLLLPKYLKKLETLGVVDFDGLILTPTKILTENESIRKTYHDKYQQIMVDEFQDTNLAQLNLIRQICGSHNNLCVVGDDDQSIYGWRGARIENILSFPTLYKGTKVVRLEKNYRSSGRILDLANHVISKNEKRHGKVLQSTKQSEMQTRPEVLVFEDEFTESEGICREIKKLLNQGVNPREIAVLYRSNSQGGFFEAELRKNMVNVEVTGGTALMDRREIKDALAFLRTAVLPNEISLRRILNCPPRGIGDAFFDWAQNHMEGSNLFGPKGNSFVKLVLESNLKELSQHHKNEIKDFREAITSLESFLFSSPSAGGALLEWLITIGYRNFLLEQYDHSPAAHQRWKNLEMLASILDRAIESKGKTAQNIRRFVDLMLLDGVEFKEEDELPAAIQLMTLHACKGLEFDHVFLVGIEEDILPHKRLGQDIAEERRLFYVGITRARKHLVLSRSVSRRKYGKIANSAASRFLLEIEDKYVESHPIGGKPMQEEERKTAMSDLLAKLRSQPKFELK